MTSSFFWISEAEPDAPEADLSVDMRPICGAMTWRIERDATRIAGSCWIYDERGYEDRMEWDLQLVDQP